MAGTKKETNKPGTGKEIRTLTEQEQKQEKEQKQEFEKAQQLYQEHGNGGTEW